MDAILARSRQGLGRVWADAGCLLPTGVSPQGFPLAQGVEVPMWWVANAQSRAGVGVKGSTLCLKGAPSLSPCAQSFVNKYIFFFYIKSEE